MSQERIIERLKKILALARQGVGGEKDNAQRMLDKLLAKHGMTLTDLDGEHEVREQRQFRIKGEAEKTLLRQCAHKVASDGTNTVSIWTNKRARSYIWIELTKAEYIEVELMFEAHRKALAKHLKKQAENALIAYIHTNKIYGKTKDDNSNSESTVSDQDLDAILGMMANITPTPVHKQIENKGVEA